MKQDGQQSAIQKLAKLHAHIMMKQMSIKQGIKEFGEKGIEALLKELNQLHEQEALLPLRIEVMSHKQMKKVLRCRVFLK